MTDIRSRTLDLHMGDKLIHGTLHVPDDGREQHPLIVMTHGFRGRHFPQDPTAAEFASAGFMVYAFDFCGGKDSGSSGDPLDRSVLTEASDLNDVLDALLARTDVDRQRVILFGRSEGGFVATYVAAHRPGDVSAMVLFFPAYSLQDDARARIAASGGVPTGAVFMDVAVGAVYNADAASFDIYQLMGAFAGPVLLLHGDADAIVPLGYSQRAAETFPNARLVVLPGEGHGFCEGGYPRAMAETMDFLRGLFD